MWAGHLREAVLLKSCVWIHQAGRTLALACLLITIYLSCWCPFTKLYACWFQQSKVITTPPASGVMPSGPSSCQQEHSSPCHFLCIGAAISPDQFAPVPSAASPAGLLSSLWMSLTAGGHSHARLILEALWRGHTARAKLSKTPLLKILLWLKANSAVVLFCETFLIYSQFHLICFKAQWVDKDTLEKPVC